MINMISQISSFFGKVDLQSHDNPTAANQNTDT